MMSSVAREIMERYGQYPIANTFSNNDKIQDIPESERYGYDTADGIDLAAKRHAACDECRKRKLKCSGESTGCSKCLKQRLTCRYSIQKQMGRPRKKQKMAEEAETADAESRRQIYNQTAFEGVCPGPISQYVKKYTPAPQTGFIPHDPQVESSSGAASDTTPSSELPPTPPPLEQEAIYPLDVSAWPDFSTMTTLPMLVQDSHAEPASDSDPSQSHGFNDSVTSFDSLNKLPAHPMCPCIPNLYLTLSTLSTISCFPITRHTVETLQTASRTAQSVIYCSVCPKKFQTGMQNVMFLGTLLTVLGDSWYRIRKAPPDEIRKGFLHTDSRTSISNEPMTDIQNLEWRTFTWQLIRANIFGDHPTPCPPSSSSPILTREQITSCHNVLTSSQTPAPTLLALVDAMERRQQFYHGKGSDTGEFSKSCHQHHESMHMQGLSLEEINHIDSNDGRLCLKIVSSVRQVVKALEYGEPRFDYY